MNKRNYAETLRILLKKGMLKAIKLIPTVCSRGVYAFVVFPVEGYASIGIAFSDRLSLSKRLAQEGEFAHPEYIEVAAWEWEYLNPFPVFGALNQLIDENSKESFHVPVLFEDMIVDVFKELRAEEAFSGAPFEADVLLGIQIPDYGDFEALTRVSSALNSPEWHEKLITLYSE